MSKEKMNALTQKVEAALRQMLPEKDGYNDVLVDAMAYIFSFDFYLHDTSLV